mmetsp:Transcript_86790/g.156319  ORF Transcript_86790/g.156319 Transcript_86790/m.156319 type:complete len:636 (-) Transcript_86790:146-2053(-)
MRRTHVRDRSPPPKMRARERGSGSLLERLRSLRSFDPVGSQRGASALTVPLASRRVPERGSLMGRFKDIAQRVRDRERLKLGSGAEATLEEEELRVGGVRGPIAVLGRRSEWQSILHDEQRRSFVSYRNGAFSPEELNSWWEDLTERIPWEQPMVGERRLPRSAAWLTHGRCRCTYRYGGTSWKQVTMEPWFLKITERVREACGIQEIPNSCNANLYVDGNQLVGWHSDNEPLFDAARRDALIISLSLGAGRMFQVHPNDTPGEITEIRLKDGDLCTMEGLMQKHYKHRVPTDRSVQEARINLTWRWIVRHDAGCPSEDRRGGVASPPQRRPVVERPIPRQRLQGGLRSPEARRGKRTVSEERPVDTEEEARKRRRGERFDNHVGSKAGAHESVSWPRGAVVQWADPLSLREAHEAIASLTESVAEATARLVGTFAPAKASASSATRQQETLDRKKHRSERPPAGSVALAPPPERSVRSAALPVGAAPPGPSIPSTDTVRLKRPPPVGSSTPAELPVVEAMRANSGKHKEEEERRQRRATRFIETSSGSGPPPVAKRLDPSKQAVEVPRRQAEPGTPSRDITRPLKAAASGTAVAPPPEQEAPAVPADSSVPAAQDVAGDSEADKRRRRAQRFRS